MAEDTNTELDTFQDKHTELRATLSSLIKQHKKNVGSKRTEAQELGVILRQCKELLRTVSATFSELVVLEKLYKAIQKPDKSVTSNLKTIQEDFKDFKEELEKTRVGLESDFINKIQGCIVEIERKLNEYESYVSIVTKGQMLRNSTVLKERISRFKEDIFDELEPKIQELFSYIIEESAEKGDSISCIEEQAGEPKLQRKHSGVAVDESATRKKRAQTATVYTYKLKNTENVTAMHYGQRIGDIYSSWKKLEAKTQVYYTALKFRLKEREVSKDLLENAEKWYNDHKDTQDKRLLVKEFERYFINGHIFDTFEAHLNAMQELCRNYAELKDTYQISVFHTDMMIELYHGYQQKYFDLKNKIDDLVPYSKANAYEQMVMDVEDKLQILDRLLEALLSTIHALRENKQGLYMNINERVVEIQNELTAGEILIGQLTDEYACLSTSLVAKKKDHHETMCSNFQHHQSDFKSCRDGLTALWIEDTRNKFVQREKFESERINISDKFRRGSDQGNEMAFLIKQSDTKQTQEDIWAPSLNLTNMSAAAELLGEMFDDDDGDDTPQAEELIGYAQDLLDSIRMWAEEKTLFLKSSQFDHSDSTTANPSFFKLQNVRDELNTKLEEFESIKSEYQAVLLKSHYSLLVDTLNTLTTQLSSQEHDLGVQLVFIQDFDHSIKECKRQLNQRRESIESIFSNNTDITEGIIQFKKLSDGLPELERAISKLTRKAVGTKKRFPRTDLTDQSSSLSDEFLKTKKEVTDQLAGARLGGEQLIDYSDKLGECRIKLDAVKKGAQVALAMPIEIRGSQVTDASVKEAEEDLKVFKTEFESIPILQEPIPTTLAIPSDTLTARDNILTDISGIHDDLTTWLTHASAVQYNLSIMISKFQS
ncbi:hypothetical protein LOD99_1183 [Oopsacas minuta]|uniref:Uncharacterized protein n=1 Tax=Oopsacas minuta TaxID=111878 RepID=A0AAV7K561_9METZ|nr:hypothetical protein LOD99_1183 [Oopsacas minuta]